MQRSWKRLWGWTAVLGALAVGAACGAEPEDDEPATVVLAPPEEVTVG